MPTDRLVTVNVQGIGDYDAAGVYHPGPDRFFRRWATLVDTSLERTLRLGGTRAEESALYRVRYFPELAGADVRLTFLTEDDGDNYRVTNITEPTGRDGRTRRRWLEVDCIRADLGSSAPTPTDTDDTDDDTDTPDMMDMGGLMAAPTFTLLSTATEGNIADDELDFPQADKAPILSAWNSGTYWAMLLDMQWEVQSQIVGQATALIPIRREVQADASLRAHFVTNINSATVDRGYLWLASGTARLKFAANSIPANAVIKLYGVS